jgi:acyl-CoA reductase-like NAD-dependent aldehyde dehydrogenase
MELTDLSMTVGGVALPAAATFDVVNPATGAVFAQAPECTQAQLDTAFESAAKAYRDWRTDLDARRAVLDRVGDLLMASAGDLAPILTAEQGKPLGQASGEIFGAGMWFKYFAALELPREIIQDDDSMVSEIIRRPLGVVAAITPWNFPLLLAAWKLAPALLAGNVVVLKPSPYTPLSSLKFGELLRGVLPDGVINVVSGTDQLGAWMTSHPVPRKVSFTGSVETGKLVAASAAPDLKRVTLELGGNDPAILLDDVDPSAIADTIFATSFANNGQTCSAIKRVYAHESQYDDIVEALGERARNATVGDPLTDVDFGPVNNRPQFQRVGELVADALAQGGTAAAGGAAVPGDGFFFAPTIIAGLTDGTRLVDEEQFGPALPVVSYRDVDDVVERANATSFGLGGSVWSADPDRAARVGAELECGTVWVNSHMAVAPNRPFGGSKWSGIGVENGPWGYYGFTELQVVNRPKS